VNRSSLVFIFGTSLQTRVFALLACSGLIASFHTIIFAYGRQIYSLSRAGYFPRWRSVTHGVRRTPHRALLAGSALGYAVALAIHLTPQSSPVGAILLNMAVFGAVVAYVFQYETDEVTLLICDSHDREAFAPVSYLTVGEFRDWLLSEQATPERLRSLAPGLTPEMVAAVSKLMRLQDLISVAAKCRVVNPFPLQHRIAGPPLHPFAAQPSD
jgi:hypothetical protein